MGIFKVLRDFRALVEAIQDLVGVLRNLRDGQQEAGPALDRVAALELSRHQFEAEIQGVLLQADGKLKAANNSEARERQLKKANEKLVDAFLETGEEVEEAGDPVRGVDAAVRTTEGLPAVRVGVAPDRKTAALNHKFGR